MFDHWIDYTDRLGFAKMPEGYKLYFISESGHFFWYKESTQEESCLHWNKWVVYKWAKFHSKEGK